VLSKESVKINHPHGAPRSGGGSYGLGIIDFSKLGVSAIVAARRWICAAVYLPDLGIPAPQTSCRKSAHVG
jgi:hypothetical protein